jgi:hypothetical protein
LAAASAVAVDLVDFLAVADFPAAEAVLAVAGKK